jgi:single-strand DNA-binding protein
MNKLILIGNIGVTPEVRTLESGTKVVNFSLATSEKWKNKAGEEVEQTEWHRIEGWNTIATAIEKNAKKGDRLFVEGKVITQKWTDNEGVEKSTTKVRIARIEFLGYRREQILNESEETAEPQNTKTKKAKTEKIKEEIKRVFFETTPDGEDLPF